MEIKIHVTKEILERSKMCGTGDEFTIASITKSCAIALAVRDLIPNVEVEKTSIYLLYESKSVKVAELPLSAQVFIKTFDKAKPEERTEMEPFSFIVDVDVTKLPISIEEVYQVLDKCPTLEAVEN